MEDHENNIRSLEAGVGGEEQVKKKIRQAEDQPTPLTCLTAFCKAEDGGRSKKRREGCVCGEVKTFMKLGRRINNLMFVVNH